MGWKSHNGLMGRSQPGNGAIQYIYIYTHGFGWRFSRPSETRVRREPNTDLDQDPAAVAAAAQHTTKQMTRDIPTRARACTTSLSVLLRVFREISDCLIVYQREKVNYQFWGGLWRWCKPSLDPKHLVRRQKRFGPGNIYITRYTKGLFSEF